MVPAREMGAAVEGGATAVVEQVVAGALAVILVHQAGSCNADLECFLQLQPVVPTCPARVSTSN